MLTPYERLLLAYLGKQPDRVPFVMGMPRDVPALQRPRESHASVWDRAQIKRSVEAAARRARYFYGRWPEAAGTRGVGTGGHGDRSVQYAQLMGPRLGIAVAYTESARGGYAYTRPLIQDLATFDVEQLYVPDLSAEPAMARVLELLAYRLACMDAAYAYNMIENPPLHAEHIMVPTKLIVRESTGTADTTSKMEDKPVSRARSSKSVISDVRKA